MAIAAATCWFSKPSTTTTSPRCSLSSQRLCSTSTRLIVNQNQYQSRIKRTPKQPPLIPSKTSLQRSDESQKFSGRTEGEKKGLDTDGCRGKAKSGQSRSTSLNSLGVDRKGRKGLTVDSKSQQVKSVTQDAVFLNAVVKVYCTHTEPDYSLPWQKQRQFTSTGSAFMIGDGKLLTNAHCVEHYTQVTGVTRQGANRYEYFILTKRFIS